MRTKWKGFVFVLLVLLALVYAGGSYYFSSVLIASPTQSLADGKAYMIELLGETNLPPPEEVSIPAGDVTLAGDYYDNPLDGRCAVLLLHGYSGTRYGAMQYAPLYWDRGCDLLAYDARGHGASTPAYHTFGYYEKLDGQAAFNWLVDRAGLQPSQVGVTGVSYGAATALQMAPLIPNAAFVLADSSYQDMYTITAYQAVQMFGSWVKLFVPGAIFFAQQRADFKVNEVSPLTAVTQTTIPILLVHAKADAYTAATHSEAIFAQSNPATTRLEITDWGAGHGGSITVDYDAFAQLVDTFLTELVPGFGLSSGR